MDFKQVYAINVNDWTEKKSNLTYLSWAHAWRAFMEVYPSATYEIVKDSNGTPCFGSNAIGYMVYTRVTVDSVTHEMWLPVMDFRNKAIKEPDMFDINKSIMRCLTKNLAMFGLGLYIYAGEDLPNDNEEEKEMKKDIKIITLQMVQDKAKEKGVSEPQILATLNKDTPEKEHINDLKLLSQAQLNGLYKRLEMVKK
jgi:hypothetical protein